MAMVLWCFYFFFGSNFRTFIVREQVLVRTSVCLCVRHAKSANFSHQLWIIALHNCDLALVLVKKEQEREEKKKLHGFTRSLFE